MKPIAKLMFVAMLLFWAHQSRAAAGMTCDPAIGACMSQCEQSMTSCTQACQAIPQNTQNCYNTQNPPAQPDPESNNASYPPTDGPYIPGSPAGDGSTNCGSYANQMTICETACANQISECVSSCTSNYCH
jgi:hypothetical protein